jgi:SAM-dependent methyltransferase
MPDPQLAQYYQDFDEHSRLANAYGQLEFTRTLELFARFLPPPPARVLDVGGATGAYSEALGQRGYETHLVDPMPRHVEAARKRSAIAGAAVGDARKLDWPAASAGAVLLMGPMYHLPDAGSRREALREARRVLEPGGLLAAAAISRFASLIDGLLRGFVDDPRFQPILLADLESGDHRNPTGNIDFFTTAHFHRPEELAEEIRLAGFVQPEVFAVEGVAWAAPDFELRWADPARREFLLELLRRTEQQPSLVGASPHLLAFARR